MNEAQPSRTALRVALRRAAHQMVDAQPLVFPDPLAVRLLPPEARDELKRTPNAERKPFSAGFRAWMVTRARLAEEVLAAGVQEHRVSQALVLGAGLDTFAYRNPHPGLRVFEVDHPATQLWKRELLQQAGIPVPDTMQFVPVDFERHSLREQLQAAGFAFGAATATSWLGVVPYLTLEAFRGTLEVLAAGGPGSSLVFDYAQPREVLPLREQLMLDSLNARVSEAGEPFRLFFTPEQVSAELRRAGMSVREDLDSTELSRRYLQGRADGLLLRGRSGRICHGGSSRTTLEGGAPVDGTARMA